MSSRPLKIIQYIGAKHAMRDKIFEVLDYSCRTYVEVFGGSGSILLNKIPHKVEIFNDLNLEIYNLFYVIKFKHKEFLDELKYIPYHEEFLKLVSSDEFLTSDVRRAVKTVVEYNFLRHLTTFRKSPQGNFALSYFNKIDCIEDIYERIKNVQIINRDFRYVMQDMDSEDTIMYLDPPYYGVNYYVEKFTHKDHEDLASLANKAKSKIVLSYYYFNGMEELYPKSKWNYRLVPHIIRASDDRKPCVEYILTNYTISNELFDKELIQSRNDTEFVWGEME